MRDVRNPGIRRKKIDSPAAHDSDADAASDCIEGAAYIEGQDLCMRLRERKWKLTVRVGVDRVIGVRGRSSRQGMEATREDALLGNSNGDGRSVVGGRGDSGRGDDRLGRRGLRRTGGKLDQGKLRRPSSASTASRSNSDSRGAHHGTGHGSKDSRLDVSWDKIRRGGGQGCGGDGARDVRAVLESAGKVAVDVDEGAARLGVVRRAQGRDVLIVVVVIAVVTVPSFSIVLVLVGRNEAKAAAFAAGGELLRSRGRRGRSSPSRGILNQSEA